MFSKQYSLSTKYAISFVTSGTALVLSSVIKFWNGELISVISFFLSMIGLALAFVGMKLKYDAPDEMSNQHLDLAAYETVGHIVLGFIILNIITKGSEIINRLNNEYPKLNIPLNQETGFIIIGLIFMSMGYHFIRYEKYGEEE